jgi:putative flippase GtrA
MIDRSLIRFLLVGVANTALGLSVIYLAMYVLHFGVVPANALGYGCGIVLSFVLNRNWTFAHDGSQLPALLRFLLVTAVAYSINLGVVVLAKGMGVNPYLAQLLGTPFYTATGYAGSRWFAFRSTARLTT